MRSSWKPLLVIGLVGGASVFAGDHFRVRAKLLPGAPAGAKYQHSDVMSRGSYWAMLEREEVVEDLNFVRQIQNPPVTAATKPTAPEPASRPSGGVGAPVNPSSTRFLVAADGREVVASEADTATPQSKKRTLRKVFRSSTRDVATTADRRSVDAAPVRLDDIRLAAYCDGRILFTGRIQELPKSGSANALVKERTDGCRVTIRVRGYSSTEVASMAVSPNGPMLFECVQTFWMAKQDDYAISLVCPEEVQLCGSHYQELTHLQVEVETRRNR